MNLKFIESKQKNDEELKFLSNGTIYFTKKQCSKLKILETSKYKVGYDSDATIINKLYFIPIPENENGFKINKSKNGTLYISARSIAQSINLTLPSKLLIGYLSDENGYDKDSFILFVNAINNDEQSV